MNRRSVSKVLAVPSGLALAFAFTACNGRGAQSTQARGREGAPISLTGCLQKTGGLTSTYILTQLNEPTESVGTSGSAGAQSGTVAREQLREARHAYRLDGDDDQLGRMVGKQVHVEGKIEERSDLTKPAQQNRENATKPADIDAGDLAEVNVTSIASVSDACGNTASGQQKP